MLPTWAERVWKAQETQRTGDRGCDLLGSTWWLRMETLATRFPDLEEGVPLLQAVEARWHTLTSPHQPQCVKPLAPGHILIPAVSPVQLRRRLAHSTAGLLTPLR